jgi:hypothetical protein
VNGHLKWLAVVALAATAGCTASNSDVGPIAGTYESSTPPSLSRAPISLKTAAQVAIPDGDVGPMALTGDRVVYPFSESDGADWSKVGVLDVATKAQEVVARSEWPNGLINWVAGTGDWIAWVDQSQRQSYAAPRVMWRIWAKNLATGELRQLSSNGETPDPFVPQVHGQEGYLFWTQAEADRTAREFAWEVGSRNARSILRHVEMTPGSETATDGQLVYLSRAAGKHRGHTVGGDCWTVPLDGHESPHPVTRTALAMGCAATDGWLVWSEHIDPNTRPLPVDGLLDNPYQIVASKLDGSEQRVLHRGYLSTGYPIVGDGFVAWQTGTSALVHALSSPAHTRLPRRLDGPSIRAGGGNIAYTTTSHGSEIIHVVKIEVRR